jgi:hypothetical protein
LIGTFPLSSILFTLVAGGLASYAAGRAVAQTWRAPATLVFYALLLALAFAFLDYALFDNPALPVTRLMLAAASGNGADFAQGVAGFAATLVWTLAVCFAAFARTRARLMAVQYGFTR